MNDYRGKLKSALRMEFEQDALLHLEALQRTALWLTMHGSDADALVLRTVTLAYRSGHSPVNSVGIRLRLFRILTRIFFDSEDQGRRSSRLLPERHRTSGESDDVGRGLCALLNRQELALLITIPDMIVKVAIARLSAISRLIMLLLLRERFSYAEIAYITDLRQDLVRSIVGRLRRQIPRYLVQQAGSMPAAEDNRTTHNKDRASSADGPCRQ